MKYTANIIQEFEGEINGIKINDKRNYYSICFMLDILIERKIKFNNEIIRELDGIIDYILRKGYISLGDFEEDVYFVIDENHLFPTDYSNRGLFEDINRKLKSLNE